MKLVYTGIIIGLAILLIAYMIFKAHHDILEFHSIEDQKLKSEFRVFFISDIHRRKLNEKTLSSIKQEIDMVMIGGDLTEQGVPLERTKGNIWKLKRWGAPIYFIWGNNDYEQSPDKLYQLLKDEGVIVLANSNHDCTINHNKISIIGLDCCFHKEALSDVELEGATGDYKILLTHTPSSFYEMEDYCKAQFNTVLAGHTHGGQIRIFGIGPYKRGGHSFFGHTNVLVSEGYGYTGIPCRLGTNAQCHVISFKNKP